MMVFAQPLPERSYYPVNTTIFQSTATKAQQKGVGLYPVAAEREGEVRNDKPRQAVSKSFYSEFCLCFLNQ